MSGHRAFSGLTRNFTPERRERIEARKKELRAAMPLHKSRQAQAVTQKAVGEVLNVRQPGDGRLERRTEKKEGSHERTSRLFRADKEFHS